MEERTAGNPQSPRAFTPGLAAEQGPEFEARVTRSRTRLARNVHSPVATGAAGNRRDHGIDGPRPVAGSIGSVRGARHAVVLLMVVLLPGLHWALLQTAAWTRMVIEYSRTAPLSRAISMTFDGRHPCPLCLAVQRGRQAEESPLPATPAPNLRWECEVPEGAAIPVRVAFAEALPRVPEPAGPLRREEPPKPRPRGHAAA